MHKINIHFDTVKWKKNIENIEEITKLIFLRILVIRFKFSLLLIVISKFYFELFPFL